jgi:hypothetical protein
VLASGANIYIPGILGTGATFSTVVDRAGSITSINIIDPGEDYISTPNVSLKVQDIVVANVSVFNYPEKGDVIYQGANSNSTTYNAIVDSITQLEVNPVPELSLFNLRVFNYNSNPNPAESLNIDRNNIHPVMANIEYDPSYTINGYKNYGDATAKATASFLNGLVVSQGQYLSSRGQPSSYDVIQSTIYNNYTYQITVEKEISKYRGVLLELLHPTGMNIRGRYVLKSNSASNLHKHNALDLGHTLSYYTNDITSNVNIIGDFTNKSNNILKFDNLNGVNLNSFVTTTNSFITVETTKIGQGLEAEIISVNSVANTITISNNIWLTFANVATITGNSGSNVINITSITNSYNIINNGIFSNTAYPLMDIVYEGDKVLVANNSSKTVDYVDYTGGTIYLTSNLSANANSYLSVNRTITTTGENIKFFIVTQ